MRTAIVSHNQQQCRIKTWHSIFLTKYGILFQAKMSGKKLSKVALTISTKGIKVVDMETKEVYVEHSIYRYRLIIAR